MRIAIINWTNRKIGGVETYLNAIIPELARAGHELSFWHEVDEPKSRESIALPDGATSWCAAELGTQQALALLGEWHPDLIYTHKLSTPELEAETVRIAPSVFFVHDYHGTCISGLKSHKFPGVRPCHRRFGWQCLLYYFPRRCGGLNPLTMVRLYKLQSRRLAVLQKYDALVTHSDHMLMEYIKHGLPASHGYNFPYYVGDNPIKLKSANESQPHRLSNLLSLSSNVLDEQAAGYRDEQMPHWRLLFSGRMELLKGGQVFLEALPKVYSSLKIPLEVIFAGDGPQRKIWESRATQLHKQFPELHIEFVGWVNQAKMNLLRSDCDLQVVPSLWPEPFGLVGPEGGLRGLPTAAFAVGGIQDWLTDGINGFLAPGDPPTADGLAEAIVNCLRDPMVYARLRLGAVELAQRFSLKNHLEALLAVFDKVVQRPPVAVSG
jgi:glycosyltransferase involved in cell wall biosynthesis